MSTQFDSDVKAFLLHKRQLRGYMRIAILKKFNNYKRSYRKIRHDVKRTWSAVTYLGTFTTLYGRRQLSACKFRLFAAKYLKRLEGMHKLKAMAALLSVWKNQHGS